jgi:PAS domain S-box-containing protein
MNEKSASKISFLEERIKILELENQMLVERSEDVFLLGTVIESISRADDSIGIMENTLERISLLKDIPFCACCSIEGDRIQALNTYTHGENMKNDGEGFYLSTELIQNLSDKPTLVSVDDCPKGSVSITISDLDFTPGEIAFFPFTSRSIKQGVFVFSTGGNVNGHLLPMLPILERTVELSVIKLEIASLVGELQQTNAELDEKVTERTRELEELTVLLKTQQESSPDGILVVDTQGKILSNNGRFKEIWGISSEILELESDDKVTQLVLDQLSEPEELLQLFIRLKTHPQSKSRDEFTLKDGKTFELYSSPLEVKQRHNVGRIWFFTDITERKKSEDRTRSSLEEKEVLLKEVHHRVKNNLQVVSGLLNLQSYFVKDDMIREYFKESQNRVKTMALMHEDLYQKDNLASIDFAEYMHNLADNLMASYGAASNGISLELDLNSALLVLDTAIPCGLIVNELLSNSFKYAFPGRAGGRIYLGFHPAEDKHFNIKISDDGVGFPKGMDFRKSKSMGLQLVTVLVEQLGGTIEMEAGKGTTFRIRFKEYREAGTALY